MHICFITSEYPKKGFPHGGVGSFVKSFGEKLVTQGHQVSVVGINYENNTEDSIQNGVNIYRIKPKYIKGLTWYFHSKAIEKKIQEIHEKTPIQIVESAELGLAYLSKINAIKYVIRLHGGHHFFAEGENRGVNWRKGFVEKRSFKKADGFIAVSDYVKSHTSKFLSYNNKPIETIFYQLNFTHFTPRHVEVETNNITFAGTVCEKKGVRQLIQAFKYIKEDFNDIKLNIYGRDWFFPDGSSYIEMLKAKELPNLGKWADDVFFHGAITFDKIPEVYAKATVCVFPSHMETLGLVAPEAMLLEKAVVFTNLGPGPEVVEHGKTGLLCNPHQPEDIAKQVIRLLSNNDFALQLGINARKSILEKFDESKVFNQNISFYSKIIHTT